MKASRIAETGTMPPSNLLLENEVIAHLASWLRANGWTIGHMAVDQQHGTDIEAQKSGRLLLIEAKGARGNPRLANVVRAFFDASQIRDHLGKAIVKVLELKIENPQATIVIAHPNTPQIRSIVEPVAMELTAIGISFAFVNADGSIEWINSAEKPMKTAAGS